MQFWGVCLVSRLTGTAFGLAALAAAIAWPVDGRAQSVTVAVGGTITTADPHNYTAAPNQAAHAHIYDRLIENDAQARLHPGLATDWKPLDATTWELHLRDATFHDGTAFTADDVVASFARVPTVVASPGGFTIYTSAIKDVEVVDPRTIRVRTKTVAPLLPVDLSQIFIIPRKSAGNPAVDDFNAGRAAIGTGPFRMVSFKPNDRIELERNDAYWGEKPAWQRATIRMITNNAARTAALLSGDVALIEAVPTADIARLRADPALKLWETASLRSIFLMLDQSREGPTPFVTGPNGEVLAKNPMRDRRVREALSIAINRNTIVDRVMEGAAIQSGQFLPAGTTGYAPDVKPPVFDVARAKALLAEAGYPNGFRVTLHGSNDRFLNDAQIVQAIGQMWTRIGVVTSVQTETWTSYIAHAARQDFSAFLLSWDSATGEASNPLRLVVATFDAAKGRGAINRERYSNPTLDVLIDRAMVTTDDTAREKLLIEGITMAMEDVAVVPLHQQKNTWASRAGLTYVPRVDEHTSVTDLRPAR
eukprot:gene9341-9422_t